MKNVLVLGAGLVGTPMALDLHADANLKVSVADIDKKKLDLLKSHGIEKAIRIDVTDMNALEELLQSYDLVLSAVPGNLGYKTLKTIIESQKTVVDISFFPENMFELDDMAKSINVTAICDMGVAPGMSHMLSAHAANDLEETDQIEIYVGGLPKERIQPWEYKAVFSPADVIEEYMRPARLVKNGKMITKPALTDPEIINFPAVGELEAFNSDGLRSLIQTMDVPDMIEKTLRYPGHIKKIALLKNSGFFSNKPVKIRDHSISPIDFTSRILFDEWQLKEGDEDLTIMRIIVKGRKNSNAQTIQYDLYDEYDKEMKVHSMARTTGYAATMAVRMLLEGKYSNPGINPPEFIARKPECVDFILEGLKERNVQYHKAIKQN